MKMEAKLDKSFGDIPDGMGAMAIMGKEGDTKHIWDKTKPAECEAAKALFNTLVNDKKYLAFKVKGADGSQGEQVKEFDPQEERYIFVPMMQGG
jgi:hypothetical protein